MLIQKLVLTVKHIVRPVARTKPIVWYAEVVTILQVVDASGATQDVGTVTNFSVQSATLVKHLLDRIVWIAQQAVPVVMELIAQVATPTLSTQDPVLASHVIKTVRIVSQDLLARLVREDISLLGQAAQLA